jgi:alkaline phosphatase D
MKIPGLLFSVQWILSMGLLAGCQSTDFRKNTFQTAVAPAPVDATGAYPVMQGVTGATWTRILVLREGSEKLEYRISQPTVGAVAKTNFRQSTHEFAADPSVVDEITIQGLKAEDSGALQILKDGKVVDERRFRLRPMAPQLRFAVVSCSDDDFKDEQKIMWSHLLQQQPDYIFAIGDNVYADWHAGKYLGDSTPDIMWKRYVETRKSLLLFRAKDLIPVIATWDDHDYGQNDGDGRYAHRKASLQIFKSFFPQDVEREAFFQGPGVASGFAVGEQRFLLLDDRSFRSPNKKPLICQTKKDSKFCQPRPAEKRGMKRTAPMAESHFGEAQTSWVMKQLEKAGSDVVWLFSGDQWFGAYSPFESFEANHPADFKKFMKSVKGIGARVAFVSGDRHASELSEVEPELLGYPSFELVSSPIHAKIFPSNWIDFPNPRQKAATAGAMNYTIVESSVRHSKWQIQTKNFKLNAESKQVGPGFEREFLIERPVAE